MRSQLAKSSDKTVNFFYQAGKVLTSREIPWRLPCLVLDNEIHADSYYKTIKQSHYHSISKRNYSFIFDCHKNPEHFT